MALVLPDKAIPALFAQFEDDLQPSHLEFIGATEFGVWGTPEGQAFVDVLADAKKKPVATQLSKQDRAALDKQLALEAEIRSQVATALGRLRRGFRLALCLVESQAELVREYLASMIEKTLAVITLQPATLVAEEAFTTYRVRLIGQLSVPVQS